MATRKHGRRFTGVYLTHWNPKNNNIHEDAGWIERRDYLNEHGWGFLATYMGYQPPKAAGDKFPAFPMPTEQDGSQHGVQAAALMRKAGFPLGSIVYLDIEASTAENSPYMSYVRAWQKSVAKASYYPGVYCSHLMISWMRKYTDAIWGFELPNGSAVTSALGLSFDLSVSMPFFNYDPHKFPKGQIYDGAVATQYFQNKMIPGCPDKSLFDGNSSLVADPSNIASVLEALNKNSVDLARFM